MSENQNSPQGAGPDPMMPWLAVAEEILTQRSPSDRLGSLNFIDSEARFRGMRAVRHGEIVSLARIIESGLDHTGVDDGLDQFALELEEETSGAVQSFFDHLSVGCHGYNNTHLDSLNHVAYEGSFYGGVTTTSLAEGEKQAPSILDWARVGIITRGVLVDIPSVRGTPWVSPDEPVTGDDIEGALNRAKVDFESGDALLLYCGRDRYEAAGNLLARQNAPLRPGVGEDAARWIADRDVSVLCWDMMDARHHSQPALPVHRLIWAIGLAIVDSCDFSELHNRMESYGEYTGLLLIAPLAIPRGTGSLVNPLMLI